MIRFALEGDDAVVANVSAVDGRVRAALSEEMQRQWFAVQARVVSGKLSGDPLRRRTGVLASSINVGGAQSVTAFLEQAGLLIGRVGTAVRYAYVHEYGGTFQVPAHTRNGRPVAAHAVTFPVRSYLRSTLSEMDSSVRSALRRAATQAARGN